MKNGYGVVRVWWLVNCLIHNHHRLTFYEKNQDGEYEYWCDWNDSQYNENEEDIVSRKIYFINALENEIEVYLREKE